MSNIPYSVASNAKEFLAGIAAEQASYYKDKQKAAKDITTFISDIDLKIRDVYDKYVPNIHVVDSEVLTKIIANKIASAGKNILDPNSDPGIARRFVDPESTEFKGLHSVVLAGLTTYHKKLLASQIHSNPIEKLNTLSNKLFIRTRKIDNPVSARVLGIEFSRSINTIFGNKAVLAVVDRRLGSSESVFVFFSSSFNAIGAPIKENVYKPIEKYIRETLGTDTVSGFALGTLVNAGHASVINELGSFVNSPAFAQIIYGVASGRSSRSTDVSASAEIFKTESKLLENSITVDKKFLSSTEGYGVLLALGVTFTNIEDAEINQERGRLFESKAVRSFGIAKPVQLSRSAAKKLTDTLMRVVFRNNPALARSSRNITEYISDTLISILAGKPAKGEKTTTVIKTTKTVKNVVRNTSSTSRGLPKPSAKLPKKVSLIGIEALGSSLVSLQNLINSQLQSVISANMGDGDSRKVLNHRTGRFAASAAVDRMSQSREGMITAFYSYMRNPYQTFEPGFKQGSPTSRDPKLLISQSIREIAATKVGNRLRAVSV